MFRDVFKRVASLFRREPETGPMTLAEFLDDTVSEIVNVHRAQYAISAYKGRGMGRPFNKESMNKDYVEQTLLRQSNEMVRTNQLPSDLALMQTCKHARILFLIPECNRPVILPTRDSTVLSFQAVRNFSRQI